MIDTQDLRSLGQISQMKYDSAKISMGQILQREAGLQENLKQLIVQRTTRSRAVLQKSDAALIAGADVRWHKWVDGRRAVINAELAQVLAQKEQCRAKLQRAFAQDQAIQALLARSIAQAKLTRERRAAYES